ncbi:MAG TPA: hypothetical protein VF654_04040, partial [Pyrinomonadaceae bacterium]
EGMADNVRPDAGDEREATSSGLLISTDPLQQDAVGHRLSAGDADADDGDDEDYNTDNGDSDGGDSGGADAGGAVVVETVGDADSGDSDDDTDSGEDPDYSDN